MTEKAEKGEYMVWNDEQKFALVKSVLKFKAYIAEKGKKALNLNEKWILVLNELASLPGFENTPIGTKAWETIQSQFNR